MHVVARHVPSMVDVLYPIQTIRVGIGGIHMVDLVVGLGQIGMPLYKLLKNRNFKVEGYDMKLPEFSQLINQRYDMIHICIPYVNEKQFLVAVAPYRVMTDHLVIHSTIHPGTSKLLKAIYSPIRGVHNDMYDQLDWFSKYYSGEYNVQFEKRFPKCHRVEDSTELERTKIMQLKYYAVLIAFRKWVDKNYPIDWSFMIELHQKFGIFPILYNDEKQIGGHCIRENHGMLEDDLLDRFIMENGG